MRPLGRAYSRRKRLFEHCGNEVLRWSDIPEEPDVDLDDDTPSDDYDRLGMMMKIDAMDRPWRDLVNAHGFSAVVKAMMEVGLDLRSATTWLDRRHQARQRELANARY